MDLNCRCINIYTVMGSRPTWAEDLINDFGKMIDIIIQIYKYNLSMRTFGLR